MEANGVQPTVTVTLSREHYAALYYCLQFTDEYASERPEDFPGDGDRLGMLLDELLDLLPTPEVSLEETSAE